MDLKFPHHECEIAQSVAHNGHDSVHYWMHNNMITINGQKMGKSLGNFITLDEFFTGSHPKLEQPYSPMVIRFFILQAHYRGTVDFSNDALQASEKALQRMLDGYRRLLQLKPGGSGEALGDAEIDSLEQSMYDAMDDDLNTPVVIAHLFEGCSLVNKINDGQLSATQAQIDRLKALFRTFLVEILGIRVETEAGGAANMKPFEGAVDLLLQIRSQAKAAKDWTTSDLIRDKLSALGFDVKDTKSGFEWKLK